MNTQYSILGRNASLNLYCCIVNNQIIKGKIIVCNLNFISHTFYHIFWTLWVLSTGCGWREGVSRLTRKSEQQPWTCGQAAVRTHNTRGTEICIQLSSTLLTEWYSLSISDNHQNTTVEQFYLAALHSSNRQLFVTQSDLTWQRW